MKANTRIELSLAFLLILVIIAFASADIITTSAADPFDGECVDFDW